MEIEIRTEGALIRGEIKRQPLTLSAGLGPGVLATMAGGSVSHRNYQLATGLDPLWHPDADAIAAAMSRLEADPRYRGQAERIRELSRGDLHVQRWMLLDLRQLGEPFVVSIEQRELVNDVLEWGVIGQAAGAPVKKIRTSGIWTPDPSLHDELDRLTLAFAAGDLTRTADGSYAAKVHGGASMLFSAEDDALAWLERQSAASIVCYPFDRELLAMSRAAQHVASKALAKVNAWLAEDTYIAVASIRRSDGEVIEEHVSQGVVGRESAVTALLELVERIHPVGFPTPRLH